MNKQGFFISVQFLAFLAALVTVIIITLAVVIIKEKQNNVVLEESIKITPVVSPSIPYIVVNIGECQYVESFDPPNYCYYSLCHKGDCTNLVHKISLQKLAEETKINR